jgi:hypothetical protein
MAVWNSYIAGNYYDVLAHCEATCSFHTTKYLGINRTVIFAGQVI